MLNYNKIVIIIKISSPLIGCIFRCIVLGITLHCTFNPPGSIHILRAEQCIPIIKKVLSVSAILKLMRNQYGVNQVIPLQAGWKELCRRKY